MLKYSLILQPSYWPEGTLKTAQILNSNTFLLNASQLLQEQIFFGRFQDFAPLFALRVREEWPKCGVAATGGN
jgi:hypothetical protein